jgi:SEC-C motif-containing protein
MGCYCGSGREKELCCLELIQNGGVASSPERLMRSRYSAYVLGDGAYLVKTTVPQNRYENDIKLIQEYAKSVTWLKLEVLNSWERGNSGFVEFKAYYKEGEKIHVHHEKSDFIKSNGAWLYEKGELLEATLGRNESCPCGSGKKFKRCCG